MRRDPSIAYVKTSWPKLSWTQCDSCNKEFKLESAWKYRKYCSFFRCDTWCNYICMPCAENKEIAAIVASRLRANPSCPVMPPCAPPRVLTLDEKHDMLFGRR